MAEQFYTILTQVGHAKLANALALGQTVNLTHMAVGQGLNGGYYDPTESQATLKSEAWRGAINTLSIDPNNANWLVAELVIPTTVGNFTVREAGLFDDAGDLIAVGKYPQTYKPQLADGAGKDLYIRLIVQVSNTSVVTLKVDPAVVLATRGYAETKATEARNAAQTYADNRALGYAQDGEHDAYTGDLDAIARNSLYAINRDTVQHAPTDMPAGVLGFVQTMVHPGGAVRTQLLWSVDDPNHPGWWRRRSSGAWNDWQPVGTGGLPVGTVLWVPGTTPPAGMLAINEGATVSRATFPELWAFAQASGLLLTEADWQAQAAAQTSVGYFSDGDGSTTFRLPRLRDFVRAADPSNGRGVGAWQEDAFQGHKHAQVNAEATQYGGVGGGNIVVAGSLAGTGAAAPYVTGVPYTDGANGTPRTANETHPKSVSWLPCIQAASVPVNAGTVDMLALASEVAGKADRTELAQNNFLHVRDEKPSGTGGGTVTAGAWRTRDLNAVKYAGISGASLATNKVTLPAGEYYIEASAPSYEGNLFRIRIRNITDNVTELLGSTEFSGSVDQCRTFLSGRMSVSGQKQFELQQYNSTAGTASGGVASSTGEVEVFSELKIWRVG